MIRIVLALFLTVAALGNARAADPLSPWQAASKTAMSITGDIALGPDRIVFQNKQTLLLSAAGTAVGVTWAPGHDKDIVQIYRVAAPPRALPMLHGNGLCAATYVTVLVPAAGRDLYLSLYTGSGGLTAANAGARLCDGYWYVAPSGG